jgi:DNA helicase-2/ATP-dependent DNA helicase PcrA
VLPSARALTAQDSEEISEERRLCYVGVTRARERLVMSFCRRRMTFGEVREGRPSRFLMELREDTIRNELSGDIDWLLPQSFYRSPPAAAVRPDYRNVERGSTTVVYDEDPPRPRDMAGGMERHTVLDVDLDADDVMGDLHKNTVGDARGFLPGCQVRHVSFGVGRVVALRGSGTEARVDVDFSSVGRRRILAGFLRLA